MRFQNRMDAGKQLGQALKGYRNDNMIVLALPRGGVPIGYEIALDLDVPLDVLIVRKLGTPGHEELAMGAIGPGGAVVLNEEVIQMLNISQATIDNVIAKEKLELQRRMQHFRGNRPFLDLERKTVVIVDDGLATGSTALAAIQTVHAQAPEKIILAVPICAPDSAAKIRQTVDDLVCLNRPQEFMAVGHWYQDFRQTTDPEVVDLLDRIWKREEHKAMR